MDVLMPQLGETVTEGTVSQWFKSVGDKVTAGELLFEIETDKTSMEVEATSSGVLAEIRVAAGQAVPVGQAVAVIQSGDAPVEATPATSAPAPAQAAQVTPEPPKPQPVAAPQAAAAPAVRGAMDPFAEVATPLEHFGPAKAANGLKITPLARRIAARERIDLNQLAVQLAKTGATRIGKSDVIGYAPSGGEAAKPRPAVMVDDAEIVQLNRIRRTTAAHLARSWAEVPHVFQAVEAGFHSVDRARRALNEGAAPGSPKLTYLPFIARAVCLALRSYPRVNAYLDGEQLAVHRYVHLGIAVDLDHEGLVVPVIRHAEGLNVIGLARAMQDAVQRARSGQLSENDLTGGTYTISNSGSFGTLVTAPIVNQPQVAILSTDGVAKRPVVVEDEDGEHIAIRPVGVVGQSFDHRAFDGAYSAAYLKELRRILETRDWLAEASAGA
ncbi:MAG: 2-oxo acid dehydrogenase subunit E2 [Rhizobiales bacterium]|nr:2-oxo acid dehydrogenase subunit E2 [Hyphomicrobiales bacterium]